MLHYAETDPPPALAGYVRCLWRLRGDPGIGAPPEPIVPDGCAELVINLADRFVRHTADGAHRQPANLVAGQITRAIAIQPSGGVDLWGVRFHPWSAAAFFGFAGVEMRDQIAPLGDVAARIARDVACVGEASGDGAQYAAIVTLLARQIGRARAIDDRLPRLMACVAERNEALTVRGLARHAGLSARRVEMLFRDDVGLSPKQVLRIGRLQRALALRRANASLTWSAIAARAGYHDQAHLIHDSRDIAGSTPGELFGELTEVFLGSGSS